MSAQDVTKQDQERGAGPEPAPARVLALCGGVGGAKLAHGLSRILAPEELFIAVNTGDDFEHAGLPVSPDLDTVMYTLAEASDPDRGWGLAGETWRFMAMIAPCKDLSWFNLGDKDLATHLRRAEALRAGLDLDEAARSLCRSFGVRHRVFPMTLERLRTVVLTSQGRLPFQDYFVRLGCRPRARAIEFVGAGRACPHPLFDSLLTGDSLRAVILCPSNPFLSIDPILSLKNARSRLRAARAPVVAVSPIVGGKALRGPAAKIMEEMNLPVNNLSVAEHYRDFLDGLIIDEADRHETGAIEKLGIRVKTAAAVMRSTQDRIALAEICLRFAAQLSPPGAAPRPSDCGGRPV